MERARLPTFAYICAKAKATQRVSLGREISFLGASGETPVPYATLRSGSRAAPRAIADEYGDLDLYGRPRSMRVIVWGFGALCFWAVVLLLYVLA